MEGWEAAVVFFHFLPRSPARLYLTPVTKCVSPGAAPPPPPFAFLPLLFLPSVNGGSSLPPRGGRIDDIMQKSAALGEKGVMYMEGVISIM